MKAAIFYYTQSGQALEIAKSLSLGLRAGGGTVIYKEIKPRHEFPFPWRRREFFDAFPESRLGLPPCGIEPIDLSDVYDAALVIVVGQSWFLSPSLPLQAFFTDEEIKAYLHGRKVVFVNGCRNMWLMTMLKVRRYIEDAKASMVGHIVLQDEAANLVSVATIVRWLLYGKKEGTGLLPCAGVAENDIAGTRRLGKVISEAMATDSYDSLQERLMGAGAIHYKPSVLMLERIGHRIFGLWARFIRRKGGFGDARRSFRCTLFMVYLVVVLYLVSPFGTLVFWLTYPLRRIERSKRMDCYEFGGERYIKHEVKNGQKRG